MKLRKDYYRNKPPRVFCEFTENEWDEMRRIYFMACREYEGFFGTGDEIIDKDIHLLRKWGKRFGWKCLC